MLLAERGEASGKRLRIKIFATDLGDEVLAAARKGRFPASMVESLSPERLARFFDKGEDDDYRIKPALRELVLFAPQNLLQDPPYSNLDLVSCRNLLIYLEPAAQEKVLALAHFALREGGYLFLGNAETIGQRDHMFATVSKRWRIYRQTGGSKKTIADFRHWPSRSDAPSRAAPTNHADLAARSLAELFAPAAVLIDRNYRVLHFHGPTDDYLDQPRGAPTQDLLALARQGLRFAIRRAVQKAMQAMEPVSVNATGLRGAQSAAVIVTASPVEDGMLAISFARRLDVASADRPPKESGGPARTDEHYEDELRTAREELQSTVEQFETTNEELKAANEEITSVNEELQSTNEELESSKEELQSLNEELNTVNAQLEMKLVELEHVGDDQRNLLSGTEVATIFLDQDLRIKWFSPAMRSLFDIIESDIGRPIANFTQKFKNGRLRERARAAIEQLTSAEDEVLADDGRCFLLRVTPYRTRDNRIAGAVASFTDVSVLKSTQREIVSARDYAEAIVETIRDPLVVLDGSIRLRSVNPAFHAMFGTSEDVIGSALYEIADRQWDTPQLHALFENFLARERVFKDYELELGARRLLLNARRIEEADSDKLVLLAIEDVTERHEAALHQELLVGELSHRVKNMLAVIQSIAAQTLRHSDSLDAFDTAFRGRLEALASANDAIINGNWKGVSLRSAIERAVAPFGLGDRLVFAARADISLRPKASLSLAMILHELTTNAIKYGALAVADGRVTVDWRVEPDDQRLSIEWAERGGAPVEPPARRGQGTRFIERSIAYELKGAATLDFAREGLHATLAVPLETALMTGDALSGTTGALGTRT